MMTARIDPGKLSDVLSLAEKLSRLDKETLIYIQGRADQAPAPGICISEKGA